MFAKILATALTVAATEVSMPASLQQACTAPKSVGQCGQCQTGDQCENGYCCPFMKKCVTSSSDPCNYPIASCQPMCYDSYNQEKCDCKNSDYPNNWAGPTCQKLEVTLAPQSTPKPTIASQPCVAKNSQPLCDMCQTSNECASELTGGYCCPYMKKCVNNGSTPCYYPIASCRPSCPDHYNQENCTCANPDYPNNWVGSVCT